MDRSELIDFVRARGLAVVATTGPDGRPEAALVGITATDRGELVFDTSRTSRKATNLEREPRVAAVIGWDDEVTVQLEGVADLLTGADLERCKQAYFTQYPDGAERARDPDICHFRISPQWLRCSDYRPETFGITETRFDEP